MAQRIVSGTLQTPLPCELQSLRGTRMSPCGAAANPRADCLEGAGRATPFIWPSVSASRIRSRLRPAASRAPSVQRCQQGTSSAASAAPWRRNFCSLDCSRCVGEAAFRQCGGRSAAHGLLALWVPMCGSRKSQAVGAHAASEEMLIARSMSRVVARCRSRSMHRQAQNICCQTTLHVHCSEETIHPRQAPGTPPRNA